jgi:hypothetical protein
LEIFLVYKPQEEQHHYIPRQRRSAHNVQTHAKTSMPQSEEATLPNFIVSIPVLYKKTTSVCRRKRTLFMRVVTVLNFCNRREGFENFRDFMYIFRQILARLISDCFYF